MAADFITNESVVSTSLFQNKLDQFHNQTVVFEFYKEIDPIACDLDYLFTTTKQNLLYGARNLDKGDNEVFATDRLSTMKGEGIYTFYDVIRALGIKYGIKHEYYKNAFGVWIDMNSIRPHFATIKPSANIFRNLITSEINDKYKASSMYTKIGDNLVFQPNISNNWQKMCCITDLSVIPAAKYYVKDGSDNSAHIYDVDRGDGTYKLEKLEPKTFINSNDTGRDLVHVGSISFTYELADHNKQIVGTGDYYENDHHKMDDLLLTFKDTDGNPYVDLSNILVFLNGMVVDYEPGPNDNQIYLNNVIRYAEYQQTGLKAGYTGESSIVRSEDTLGNSIVTFDIPVERRGYEYIFDIRIYKWDGVKISRLEEPLDSTSLLKTEPSEEYKSVWLTDGLNFSSEVDKDKCLLLCGNEIMSKDSWDVDPKDSNHVILKHISSEFDVLYSEMYRRLRIYLAQSVEHELSNAPKITDFLTENITSFEEVQEAMDKYQIAINDYIDNGGEYNYHYTQSALLITANQFLNRQYALIKFSSENSDVYDIELKENHHELRFNAPVKNKFINENFKVDDIIIINGIKHIFVNDYDNVFSPVPKWYLVNINGVFDDVNGYKLEVLKHKLESNKYLRLNKSQISYGINPDQIYYTYDASTDSYIPNSLLTEFDVKYVQVSQNELAEGVKKEEVYYTFYNSEFVKVPTNFSEFEMNTVYYKLVVNKDYYVKIS
jgi:hypothetical protein